MKRTALLFPALVLAVSFLAAGCGGDDDKKSDEAITKAEFIKQADEICAQGNEDIATASEAIGDSPTSDEIEAFATDTLVPNIQDQHDAIDELGAPKGDEDDVDAILGALQTGIDTLSEDPAGAMSSAESPFTAANELAGAYGLTECGA